jgi:hypothetical protein
VCATAPTRTLPFRTQDGGLFDVVAFRDGAGLRAILSVEWRGVELCTDCFLSQLDDEEHAALDELLREPEIRRM